MIYLKENPIGVDVPIQRIQERLYNDLGYEINAYGRAYLNKRGDNTVPEVLIEESNEYQEVLLNDCENGVFFFIENNTTKISSHTFRTNVDLIMSLKLCCVKPDIKHRADEEVKIDVYKVLRKCVFREDIEITKGIEALRGFESNLKDMQPNHFVKFSFPLEYNIKC